MMRITRAEWVWAILASVLVVLLSTIPYVVGYISENAEWKFGGAVFDRQDYNVHLASIQTGLRGEWMYPLLHTPENVSPAFIKTFYIFVGQLGRLVRLSPPMLYEITRWVCGLWMLLTLYAFIARFIETIVQRHVAFLFGALGSGIGWLMMLTQSQPDLNVSPIDFWLIDLYTFFSLLALPHFAAVFALLWTATLAMLAYWDTHQWRWLALSIICILCAQQIQSFAPLVVDVALVGYASWGALARRIRFPLVSLAIFAVAQIPFAVHALTILYGDPIWSNFSKQNVTLSPAPIYYILGLGIPGILALLGGWRVMRGEFGRTHLLLVWVLSVAALVYVPVTFQRRFTEGVSAPLAILATLGLGSVNLSPRARNLIATGLVAVSMISTLYLAFGGAMLTAARSPKLFEPTQVVAAMDWLGANSDWRDTVFSSERTGSYIPARIGQRVYLGHEMETAHYADKSKIVARFFDTAMSDLERQTILRECQCRFVFWGPYERALGAWRPDAVNYLTPVFTNDLVTLYRVADNP